MEKKRLFCDPDSIDYFWDNGKIKKSYCKFVDNLNSDNPITTHPHLEPYRKNIKKLVFTYSVVEPDLMYDRYWREYVDKVVWLSQELGDMEINSTLMDNIEDAENPDAHALIDLLETILVPEKVEKFETYINCCYYIVRWYFQSAYETVDNKNFDFGNEELNKLYLYLSDLSKKNYDFSDMWDEDFMLGILFAYLHYNHITDYDLIKRYLDDPKYYQDKTILNNCVFYKYDMLYPDYYYENIKLVFNNINEFFTKEKGCIR